MKIFYEKDQLWKLIEEREFFLTKNSAQSGSSKRNVIFLIILSNITSNVYNLERIQRALYVYTHIFAGGVMADGELRSARALFRATPIPYS